MKEEDLALTLAQEDAVQYILRPESDGAALLAFDMGLGKTRTGLMVVRESGAEVALVVAPLQTLDDWAKTAVIEAPHLPLFRIASTKEGQAALVNFQWRARGVYLVGHEYWERLAWTKQPLPKRKKDEKQRFRKVKSSVWDGSGYTLIFDESHRSANHTSWTHRALMNINPDVFKLSMSGTFFGDKFDGAYGSTRWLWPHRTDIIPNNIYDWRARWAKTIYDRFAPRNEKTVGERAEGEFVKSLPCYIRMETDLPEPEVKKLWVDLYPEQRRVYDELEDRMVAWIEDNPLTAEISITRRARQRQATLAMPTLTFEGNELKEVSFDLDAESVKIDRLIHLLENELKGERVLCLTDSQKFASILTHRLNEKFGESAAREWSGKVKRADRVEVKQQFLDGDIQYLVGVQAAMGTGTDGLQSASNNLVFMSRADRRIDNQQAIARLNRKGQTKVVTVWSILARDSIDTGQLSKQVKDAMAAARIMRKKAKKQ